MIVQCTKDELVKVIDYARSGQLVYLRIEKKDDVLIMDYKLISSIKNESVLARIEYLIKTSLKTTFDLISNLGKLNNILNANITPISYSLTYDCDVNSNVPLYSLSSALPTVVLQQNEEPVKEIEWDKVFADKLNEIVPGLYSKKSSKKYAPITYSELIEVLRN